MPTNKRRLWFVGIPRDHPESYHSFMYTNFFRHIDIDPKNVHILDGNAPDLEKECENFEKIMAESGGVQLFIGGKRTICLNIFVSATISASFAGIGPDGHIAFNEPGSSLVSRTRLKTLAKETIIANARFFGNDMSKVPTMALTVGVGTVMDAKEVKKKKLLLNTVIFVKCSTLLCNNRGRY